MSQPCMIWKPDVTTAEEPYVFARKRWELLPLLPFFSSTSILYMAKKCGWHRGLASLNCWWCVLSTTDLSRTTDVLSTICNCCGASENTFTTTGFVATDLSTVIWASCLGGVSAPRRVWQEVVSIACSNCSANTREVGCHNVGYWTEDPHPKEAKHSATLLHMERTIFILRHLQSNLTCFSKCATLPHVLVSPLTLSELLNTTLLHCFLAASFSPLNSSSTSSLRIQVPSQEVLGPSKPT